VCIPSVYGDSRSGGSPHKHSPSVANRSPVLSSLISLLDPTNPASFAGSVVARSGATAAATHASDKGATSIE
jgi:hypothetical protein